MKFSIVEMKPSDSSFCDLWNERYNDLGLIHSLLLYHELFPHSAFCLLTDKKINVKMAESLLNIYFTELSFSRDLHSQPILSVFDGSDMWKVDTMYDSVHESFYSNFIQFQNGYICEYVDFLPIVS